MIRLSRKLIRLAITLFFVVVIAKVAFAAPYATVVMDARNGKVIYSRGANQVLHPASLTKMMTLYVAFSEIQAGRLSLNQKIRISKNAAAEPPSKMGLRAGQEIELFYLLRACAIKSANDAATAIGEHIAGSEANFASHMTQVARGLGMKNTRFKNAHGLTQSGHQSTAYDMALLGRRLVYDHPKYYNLFSREYAKTPLGSFRNSNIRFLRDYSGADGIKTGYTNAAGYNLVASARRGNERIIVSMFGGQSSYQRNQQIGALMDLGFTKAPSNVRLSNLPRVRVNAPSRAVATAPKALPKPTPKPQAPKVQSKPKQVAVARTLMRPPPRQIASLVANAPQSPQVVVRNTTNAIAVAELPKPVSRPATLLTNVTAPSKPTSIALATTQTVPDPEPTPVPAIDTSGNFAIQLGAKPSNSDAEKYVISTALSELEALGTARNSVIAVNLSGKTLYRPRFSGLSEEAAYRACARIQSRNEDCYVIAPPAQNG